MNALWWIGGSALALWLYTKAHTAMNLQFLPLGANWDGGALHVQIGVQNPTNNSLQVTSLAGTVYVNGTAAGNLSDFTPALIAPNSQTPIQLTYTPSLFGAISSVLNQLTNGGGVNIEVKGTANVNSIPIPVDIKFQAIS